jgi:hypothetical protein
MLRPSAQKWVQPVYGRSWPTPAESLAISFDLEPLVSLTRNAATGGENLAS